MQPGEEDGMAHLLFIGASGRDRGACPYGVLAGVAVEDRDLWNLAQAMGDARFRHFGVRLPAGDRRVRARNLLKNKTFRLAAQIAPLAPEARREAARSCLEKGSAGRRELAALAQAKLAYAAEILELCARYRCRLIASIAPRLAVRPSDDALHRDFLFLFERFYYLLDDIKPSPVGIVVSREDAWLSRRLPAQMDLYFKRTGRGRQHTSLVVPEPLTVAGDLAEGCDIASVVAYTTAWGFRTKELTEPARRELFAIKEQVRALRYRAVREVGDNPNFIIWGFSVVGDLRTREERTLIDA
jgi:hypothetical protein